MVHHENHEKVKCDECDNTFKNKRYMKTHKRLMHNPERTKFVCDDCGKVFNSKHNFQMHCLKIHSNVEEQNRERHTCHQPGCDYSSLFKHEVKRHYKRSHLKQYKTFPCSFCPKSLNSNTMLKEHINGVHLNLRPYKCDSCEFATAYSTTLREHKKVAHGNQRYDCPHCNHSARYKGNLDKHINNVHKNLMDIMIN